MKSEVTKRGIMILDPQLPLIQEIVPLHPATGLPWKERWDELRDLATLILHCEGEDATAQQERRNKWQELTAGVQFAEAPYIEARSFIVGSASLLRAHNPKLSRTPTQVFACHPDTWAAIPEAKKAFFDPEPVDAGPTIPTRQIN